MWEMIMAIHLIVMPPQTPSYVSCPDGHIVLNLGDCPPIIQHHAPGTPPIGGGPRGRGGLLGLGIGGIL